MALPVVVIGAGIGGLSAAAELARAGEEVLIVEARDAVGGKARAIELAGRSIDVGPTVLTMRWVFDELFGCPLDRVLSVRPLDRIARHVFADGSWLDLYPNVLKSADAIGAFAGPKAAAGYIRFAAYSQKIAETIEDPFLRSDRPTFASLVLGAQRLGLGAFRRIDAHRTMWSALGSFFDDARLRALFARYATYVGSSPFEAAATFNLIAHVEREGVVAVDGGISRLAHAVADLAASRGAKIELGTRAKVMAADRDLSVELTRCDGAREIVPARAVVLNADVATIAAGHFGAVAARAVDAPPAARRSLSAVTWAIAGSAEGFELDQHNVFFGADYERETRTLWQERALPDDPTVYVCAPDRERFFLIANAPSLDAAQACDEMEIERCERSVFMRLARAGVTFRKSDVRRMTPHDFARMEPGTGGAIYGEASHGPLASLPRPGTRTRLRGLYLAGGSVHPGPGVPMAAMSGRLAARSILGDLVSTRPSSRAGIAGSISTR